MARKAGNEAAPKRGGASGKKAPKPKPLGTDFLDTRLSKALAHGMRVNIMAVASWRKISPSEYAKETGEKLSRVS